MSIEACEGGDGDGVVWREYEDRDSSTRGASAVNATFESIVPGSQQFYLARASYSPRSMADVVLCGDDDKKSSGRVEGKIEASKNNDGSSEGRASISIEHKTDNGFEITGEIGGNVRQEKNGDVQTGGFGSMKFGMDY